MPQCSSSLNRVPVRHLQLENLEGRCVPAGNLTAFVSDSRLTIRGNELDNQVQIVPDGGDGVLIMPLDATTTVNGQGSPVGFQDIKHIDVHLMEGNDALIVVGLSLRNLHVDGGAGDDKVVIDGVYARHSMTVLGNSGDDDIKLTEVTVRRQLMLHAGDGKDLVTVAKSHFGKDGQIDGGAGSDTLINQDYSYDRNFGIFDFENPPATEPPIAEPDEASVDEGAAATIDVVANDRGTSSALEPATLHITAAPAHGQATANPDGTVTYVHDGSETTSDTFRYTIKDQNGEVSNEVVVTVTVVAINDDPVAGDDESTVSEGFAGLFSLIGNDSDPEGRLDVASISIVANPTNGTLTVNGDGTVTYLHDGSETTTDSFDYTIADADGGISNIANVQILVLPVNDAPIANPDSAIVSVEGSVVIDLVANDTDDDNVINRGSILIQDQPQHGTVTINGDGTVTYEHDGSRIFSDTFVYTVADAAGLQSNAATVTVFVNTPEA